MCLSLNPSPSLPALGCPGCQYTGVWNRLWLSAASGYSQHMKGKLRTILPRVSRRPWISPLSGLKAKCAPRPLPSICSVRESSVRAQFLFLFLLPQTCLPYFVSAVSIPFQTSLPENLSSFHRDQLRGYLVLLLFPPQRNDLPCSLLYHPSSIHPLPGFLAGAIIMFPYHIIWGVTVAGM